MGHDRVDQFIDCGLPMSRLYSRIHESACQDEDNPNRRRIRCLSGRYHLQPERIQVKCSTLAFAEPSLHNISVSIIYVNVFDIDGTIG